MSRVSFAALCVAAGDANGMPGSRGSCPDHTRGCF